MPSLPAGATHFCLAFCRIAKPKVTTNIPGKKNVSGTMLHTRILAAAHADDVVYEILERNILEAPMPVCCTFRCPPDPVRSDMLEVEMADPRPAEGQPGGGILF